MTSSTLEEPIRADPDEVAVYGTEHQLRLVVAGQPRATAIVTGWGTWHIPLGHMPVGPGHARRTPLGRAMYRPRRRAWLSLESRWRAADQLYAIGQQLLRGRLR